MPKDLQIINSFINEHHVMSLATSNNMELSVCSLFYAYCSNELSFVVASSDETMHIKNIKQNKIVAGNILLETKSVAKIQGLQFRGEFILLEDESSRKLYFKEFPYALAMQPKLWKIKVNYFKLTDNRFGFGKKLIWKKT
ncbi:MAG: hypothetical protein AUK54_02070 [Helicobacteraceae bacterium CG2_30_36_10]|nr:MAG: hypothetical protein AUK54_02070 [Helicobacteraceae bacterium CG2_30_36_10]